MAMSAGAIQPIVSSVAEPWRQGLEGKECHNCRVNNLSPCPRGKACANKETCPRCHEHARQNPKKRLLGAGKRLKAGLLEQYDEVEVRGLVSRISCLWNRLEKQGDNDAKKSVLKGRKVFYQQLDTLCQKGWAHVSSEERDALDRSLCRHEQLRSAADLSLARKELEELLHEQAEKAEQALAAMGGSGHMEGDLASTSRGSGTSAAHDGFDIYSTPVVDCRTPSAHDSFDTYSTPTGGYLISERHLTCEDERGIYYNEADSCNALSYLTGEEWRIGGPTMSV